MKLLQNLLKFFTQFDKAMTYLWTLKFTPYLNLQFYNFYMKFSLQTIMIHIILFYFSDFIL
jgi:hypothetical protein